MDGEGSEAGGAAWDDGKSRYEGIASCHIAMLESLR